MVEKMISKADLEASQELQNKGIQLEFQNVHQRFDKVDERFNEVNERSNKMDERFSKVDERFNKMDERFNKMNESFNKIDERFGELTERFEGRFCNLEARILNSKASKSWDNIYPLGFFDSSMEGGGRFKFPEKFPNNLTKFCHLAQHRNLPQLVGLVEFYRITGWQTWGAGYKINDDLDIGEPLQLHFTVHDAVHARPEMALQELASYLGLEYSRIKEIMEIMERKSREQTPVKIRRVADAGKEEEKKEKKERQTKPFRPNSPIPKEVLSPQTFAKYMGKSVGAPPPPSRPSTKRGRDPRVSSPSSSGQKPAAKIQRKEENDPHKTSFQSSKKPRNFSGLTVSDTPKKAGRETERE